MGPSNMTLTFVCLNKATPGTGRRMFATAYYHVKPLGTRKNSFEMSYNLPFKNDTNSCEMSRFFRPGPWAIRRRYLPFKF